MQTILDFAIEEREHIGEAKFKKLVVHMLKHEEIVIENTVARVQTIRLDNEIRAIAESALAPSAPQRAPQPVAPAPSAPLVIPPR